MPRRVRASTTRSRLRHTGAIEERILSGIARRLGDEPHDDGPSIPLLSRIHEDRCTLSLDASGDPLHRRGYRKNPHRAPLREDVARALVLASNWDRQSLFVDPMCGSGTIAIEAALLAENRAPGLHRSFAIEDTPLDDGIALQSARRDAEHRFLRSNARIIARDRDARAIEAARANAERAGVSHAIDFEVGPLSRTLESLERIESRGAAPCIVTNPPWGERLDERASLPSLYRALGQLRHAMKARLTIATHDRRLAYATGVRVESAFLSDLGGLKMSAMTEKQ
jgi:putative N6-adenine-specific DNA methylase